METTKFFQQRNCGFPQQMEKSPITIIKPSGTESANMQQQQQQPNPLNRIATPLPQGISRQSQLQLKQNEKRKKKKESILTVVVKTLTLYHLRTMKKQRKNDETR
uniref:Uncharacterized protein n=1 Tax=Salix viminalis TaxID=40686 RepID=A0A6N2LH31_SALVM